AYVIGREFGFRSSLSGTPWRARGFYAALAASLLIGVIISFAGISPIQLLFVSSIVGGLGTPISMVFLLLIGQNRELMGEETIGMVLRLVGWATVVIVSVISTYFLWQQFGTKL
ncbi:MAG: divalent metal cation transporter, partial [Chloroflexota bacterium]|nr:divalent metal cation transporter [Chloroflexota bacterium]